jgi:hypothetical protein
MSGPKVVRIVTIEEVLEICGGHLARIEDAIQRWERIGRRNDAVTEEDIRAMRARQAEIAALLEKKRYLDLQKRAPEEVRYIEADIERRLADATRRAAEARTRDRRRATLAAQLLKSGAVKSELRATLEAIARGDVADAVRAEAALGEALRKAPTAEDATALVPELRALAERHAHGLEGRMFDEWLATEQSADESDVVADEIDAAIAGLAVAGSTEEAEALSSRYKLILAEPSSARRKMRSDTLLIEIGRTLAAERERRRALDELASTAAEARASLAATHSTLLAEAANAIRREDAASASSIVTTLQQALAEHRKASAATARRQAVLSALAEVGYEAREGLATARPIAGRMVLRRAANPEVGLEVSGGTANERVQLRPVRFAAPGATGDASRDRDIETIWCSDFDRLRESLARLDADVALEKAMPIGATPVMVVEQATQEAGRGEVVMPETSRRSI